MEESGIPAEVASAVEEAANPVAGVQGGAVPGAGVAGEAEENAEAEPVATPMARDAQARLAPVSSTELETDFSAPSSYDEIDITDRGRDAMKLWVKAPWFNRRAVELGGICEYYADANGWLPCGVQLAALATFAWRHHFCCEDDDLFVPKSRNIDDIRRAFVVQALSGLSRFKTFTMVPANLDMDLFQYRTQGEIDYVRNLANIGPELIEEWRGQVDVDDRALCYAKPQLCVEFRFLEKGGSIYWNNYVRNERRLRASTGLAIPYQCLTEKHLTNARKAEAFPKLTIGWSRLEVPMGCYAELPQVLSYKGRYMLDEDSGWWVVGYTEKTARTSAFVLFDAYDNFRIWKLSRKICLLYTSPSPRDA